MHSQKVSNSRGVGITGFGSYVPSQRLVASDISKSNPYPPPPGLSSKSSPARDEDAITMAVEAGFQALQRSHITPQRVQAVYIGSESHPYAVKPSSTMVASALGIGPWYMAVDTQFACKAATATLQWTMGLVQSGMIDCGMCIGSDTAQARPGDVLEYTAAAGAAAFILSAEQEQWVASLDATVSYTTNTPDFWRRPHQEYPEHGFRFTAEPAYFSHVLNCAQRLFEVTKSTAVDYDYVVLHQPNVKFPEKAAKKLGFTEEQLRPGLLSPEIGNCYAAASVVALAAVLDVAKLGEKIFMISYGSGSGSDGFVLTKC